jgi:hypothetical protein
MLLLSKIGVHFIVRALIETRRILKAASVSPSARNNQKP